MSHGTTERGECLACGHDGVSHQSGRCTVTWMEDATGRHEYGPEGCGCAALTPNTVCPRCQSVFFCFRTGEAGHPVHECWSCYQRGIDEAAQDSFAPLTEALLRHGVTPDEPWNTGGNVMCLPVLFDPIPFTHPITGGEEQYKPYLLFSDDAEWIGCALYYDEDGGSLSFEPSWAAEYAGDDFAYDWGIDGLAERLAAWVAAEVVPACREWLKGITVEGHPTHYGNDCWPVATNAADLPLPVLRDGTVDRV